MRNNLGVGIVSMTVDPVNNDNNTNSNSTSYHRSMVSILFPNYRTSRQQSFLNDEFEDCPSDVSSGEGSGEVRPVGRTCGSLADKIFHVAYIVARFLQDI